MKELHFFAKFSFNSLCFLFLTIAVGKALVTQHKISMLELSYEVTGSKTTKFIYKKSKAKKNQQDIQELLKNKKENEMTSYLYQYLSHIQDRLLKQQENNITQKREKIKKLQVKAAQLKTVLGGGFTHKITYLNERLKETSYRINKIKQKLIYYLAIPNPELTDLRN